MESNLIDFDKEWLKDIPKRFSVINCEMPTETYSMKPISRYSEGIFPLRHYTYDNKKNYI